MNKTYVEADDFAIANFYELLGSFMMDQYKLEDRLRLLKNNDYATLVGITTMFIKSLSSIDAVQRDLKLRDDLIAIVNAGAGRRRLGGHTVQRIEEIDLFIRLLVPRDA